MAIGFPPYFKDRRTLKLSPEVAKAKAITVLEEMNCREIALHPFALDYVTPGAILATGERIYVNITDSEIIIRSECIFFTRIVDFGKNKANIDAFWKIYDRIVL